MQDVIERNIIVGAPIERVFASITEPADFAKWFAKGVEGDFEVGSQPIIDEGEYGRFRLVITGKESPRYFAFRWVSGMEFIPQGFTGDVLSHPNTLVEFFLEPDGDSTRLRLLESGFASLPESYAAKSFGDNSEGWDYQLARLQKFAVSGSAE